MKRLLPAALLFAGCGQNAVLELTIDLPAAPADCGEWFAAVQPRTSDNPFAEEWPPNDLPPIALGPSEMRDEVSVVTENVELDVHLKIRFCRSPDCLALSDGACPADDTRREVWYRLEHPFYEGKRTSFHIEVPAVPLGPPAEAEVVERCLIQGCITGTSVTFCTSDGRHVCED